MIRTIFEEKFDEGVAVGKADGKVEGKAEDVIKVLRARVNRVPKWVVERVMRIRDIAVLDSLIVLAAQCNTIDEFTDALN